MNLNFCWKSQGLSPTVYGSFYLSSFQESSCGCRSTLASTFYLLRERNNVIITTELVGVLVYFLWLPYNNMTNSKLAWIYFSLHFQFIIYLWGTCTGDIFIQLRTTFLGMVHHPVDWALPTMVSLTVDWALPHQSRNSQKCPQANLIWSSTQLRFLFPKLLWFMSSWQ